MVFDDQPDKDADAVAEEIAKKYEILTEALRETVNEITDMLKAATDEIDHVDPDSPSP